MAGQVDVPFGRYGEVDGVGHDLFGEVAIYSVDFDAFSYIECFDVGKVFFFVDWLIDLLIFPDPSSEIVLCNVGGLLLVV